MYYFDYAATTPCEEEVLKEMELYFSRNFGNSSSRSHAFGWESEQALENARKIIADFLNVNSNEIFFTSGATESVNLALQGFVKGFSFNGKKIGAIITDHKSTIETLRYFKQEGIDIEFLNVNQKGLIDLEYLTKNISQFSLLSLAYVNNETGVVQEVEYISKLCRENGVFLHLDAAQAYGKIKINARICDLMSISGHKIYGPKGVGVLFVSKNPRVRINPLFFGGGQERGLRSGTVAVALCVGLAKATEIAIKRMESDFISAKNMQDRLINELVNQDWEITLNGDVNSKLPNIINLSIPYIEGESLLMRLNKFAISSGSACTSKTLEPSYVISAMFPENKDLAHSSLRICWGRGVTLEMIDELVMELKKNIIELRCLSPLWSMKKKGIDLKSIKWKQ